MLCGTPFSIGSLVKDSVFIPGTIGYVSLLQGPDYKNPNIAFIKAVVIRRGVGGKDRINSNTLLCPIFKSKELEDRGALFPKGSDDVEYKYLVDLKENQEPIAGDVLYSNYMSDITFMGWLLSKSLLLKALDTVVYDAINESLGIYEEHRNKVWKPRHESLLSEFTHVVESQVATTDLDYLSHTFCTKDHRQVLVSELHDLEAKLAIPKIEYNKRVVSTIFAAFKHVKESMPEMTDNGALESNLKGRIDSLNAMLKNRLKVIEKNRKMLKI